MKKFVESVKQFLVCEDGPTAVEYAVLVGLIIVALLVVIGTLQGSIAGIFGKASTALDAVP